MTTHNGNSVDLILVLKKEADVYAGSITAAGFVDNEEIRDVEFKDNNLNFSFTVYNGSEYLEVKINLSVSEDRMTGGWESEDGNFGDIMVVLGQGFDKAQPEGRLCSGCANP